MPIPRRRLTDPQIERLLDVAGNGVMRNWLVGILWAIGVFLVLYRGYGRRETTALNFAGIVLIMVAMFPMDWSCGSGGTERAIGWYERGLSAEDGGASLRSSEPLANLRVRRAWNRLKAASSGSKGATTPLREQLDGARDGIENQLTILDQLNSIGKTMERICLCGSAFKPLAADKLRQDPHFWSMSSQGELKI